MKIFLVAYIALAWLGKAFDCLQPHMALPKLSVIVARVLDKQSSLCGGCLLICRIPAFSCLKNSQSQYCWSQHTVRAGSLSRQTDVGSAMQLLVHMGL